MPVQQTYFDTDHEDAIRDIYTDIGDFFDDHAEEAHDVFIFKYEMYQNHRRMADTMRDHMKQMHDIMLQMEEKIEECYGELNEAEDLDGLQAEVGRLYNEIEEANSKNGDLELENLRLQRRIEALEAQQNNLWP